MADRKSKARGAPKSGAAKAKPTPDERSQRERFIEAAESAGVTDETFNKALARVALPKSKTAS